MKPLRTTIELLNVAVGRLKARRRLETTTGVEGVCINLGSGLAVAKGWINIDGSLNALVASMPSMFHSGLYQLTGARQYYSREDYCRILRDNVFVHHDLAFGIPFQDCSADYIYSSHFVEHLSQQHAVYLMQESYRVLKKGGLLRLSIPDLEYAVSLYALGRKREMLQQYFFVDHDDSVYSRHKYMYDFQMIRDVLTSLGFVDVSRGSYRTGECPSVTVLDNRPEDSLFVEARK
ncbi:MAG: hypothetical protein JW395_2084 [Nitrospira sp.]|nr:hypothetical protein [Nitrospira sp.]